MSTVKKITEYVLEHLVQFLLLAVCLTLCLAMRYAALGKYVSYIQESSQAVAGEFFFTSNYLKKETQNYLIANWHREVENDYAGDYISFDLRNYSNSLKYNKEGQNFFYYVTTDYYADPECTTKIDGEVDLTKYDIRLDVRYGDEAKDGSGNVKTNADGIPYGNNEVGMYNGHVVGMLSGGSTSTDKIYIHIYPNSEVNKKITDTVYVKVEAHNLPISEMNKVKMYNADYTLGSNYAGSSTIEGVFTTSLSAIFQMGSTESDAVIHLEYDEDRDTDSTRLWLTVLCDELKGQGYADVKLYYDSTRIAPINPDILTPIQDPDYDPDQDEEYKKQHPYEYYVPLQVNSGGNSSALYFQKLYSGNYTPGEAIAVTVVKTN